MEKNKKPVQPFVWTVSSGILNNLKMMKQVGVGLLIGVSFVILLIFFIQAIDPYTKITGEFMLNLLFIFLMLVGIMSVCMIIGVLLIYRNKYEYTFTISERGIKETAGKKQKKKNAIVSVLLVIGGFFAKSPSAMGAGVLAHTTQTQFLAWKDVDKIELDIKKRAVLLKKRKRTRMFVFCTQENFEAVQEMIRSYIKQKK